MYPYKFIIKLPLWFYFQMIQNADKKTNKLTNYRANERSIKRKNERMNKQTKLSVRNSDTSKTLRHI